MDEPRAFCVFDGPPEFASVDLEPRFDDKKKPAWSENAVKIGEDSSPIAGLVQYIEREGEGDYRR